MSAIRNRYFDAMMWLYRRAGRVIVPTAAYGRELSGFDRRLSSQMRPILHGIDKSFFAGEVPTYAKNHEFPLVTITNHLPHKNLVGALDGYFALKANYPELPNLRIVGRVSLNDVQSVASDDYDLSCIDVSGEVPHSALPKILSASSLLLFVSHVETYGMPISEAMASGIPVVASRIPVHEELAKGSCILVDSTNSQAIAGAILDALQPEKWDDLQSRGLARARELTWRRAADCYIDCYREIAEGL